MPIGDGYFGSPKGTFGKYVTGPTTSPLSVQFSAAPNVEEQQRRRYRRKHESGYVGNGYTWGYPYVVGELINHQPTVGPDDDRSSHSDGQTPATDGMPAAATDGAGMGGTAAGFVGGLGS
jgi:hypothetical protein